MTLKSVNGSLKRLYMALFTSQCGTVRTLYRVPLGAMSMPHVIWCAPRSNCQRTRESTFSVHAQIYDQQ